MTLTTLVCGARASIREAKIAEALDGSDSISNFISNSISSSTAVILEGMPDGTATLDLAAAAKNVLIARIAPGCLCCTGNLTMRVTLNRILRRPPARLFISIANAEHLGEIRRFLQQAPYDKLLTLTADLHA